GTVLVSLFVHFQTLDLALAQQVVTPPFQEAWRLDDDDVLIGLPVDVQIGKQGRIYILDGKLLDVKVFSAEGDFIESLGRQGDGPGEFRNASAISFLPDGSVGVAQAYPA